MSYPNEYSERYRTSHDYGRSQGNVTNRENRQYGRDKDYNLDSKRDFNPKSGRDMKSSASFVNNRQNNGTNSRKFDYQKATEARAYERSSFSQRKESRPDYPSTEGFGKDLTRDFNKEGFKERFDQKSPYKKDHDFGKSDRKFGKDASPLPERSGMGKPKTKIGVRRGFNRHLYGADPRQIEKSKSKPSKSIPRGKDYGASKDVKKRAVTPRGGEGMIPRGMRSEEEPRDRRYDFKLDLEKSKSRKFEYEKKETEENTATYRTKYNDTQRTYKNYEAYKPRENLSKRDDERNKEIKPYNATGNTRDLRLANLRARRGEGHYTRGYKARTSINENSYKYERRANERKAYDTSKYEKKYGKDQGPSYQGYNQRDLDYKNKDYGKEYGKDYGKSEYSNDKYETKDYGRAEYSKKDYGVKEYKARDYGSKEYRVKDYSAKGYGTKDYGAKEYGTKDYGAKEYGAKDYGAKDYGAKEYGAKEYGTKDYEKKEYDREDRSDFDMKKYQRNERQDRPFQKSSSNISRLHEEWKRERQRKSQVFKKDYAAEPSQNWRERYPRDDDKRSKREYSDNRRKSYDINLDNKYKKTEERDSTSNNRQAVKGKLSRNALSSRGTKSQIQIGRSRPEMKLDFSNIKKSETKLTPRKITKGHTYGYRPESSVERLPRNSKQARDKKLVRDSKPAGDLKFSKLFEDEAKVAARDSTPEKGSFGKNRVQYPHLKYSRKLRSPETPSKRDQSQYYSNKWRTTNESLIPVSHPKNHLYGYNPHEDPDRNVRSKNKYDWRRKEFEKRDSDYHCFGREDRKRVSNFKRDYKEEERARVFNFKKGSFRAANDQKEPWRVSKYAANDPYQPSRQPFGTPFVKKSFEAEYIQRSTFSPEGFYKQIPLENEAQHGYNKPDHQNDRQDSDEIRMVEIIRNFKEENPSGSSSLLTDKKNSPELTTDIFKDSRQKSEKESPCYVSNEKQNYFSGFSFQNKNKLDSKSTQQKTKFETANPSRSNYLSGANHRSNKILKKSTFEFFSKENNFRICKFMKKTNVIGVCDSEADGVLKSKMMNWRSKKVLTSQRFDCSK